MNNRKATIFLFFAAVCAVVCQAPNEECFSADLPSFQGLPASEVIVTKSKQQIRITVYAKDAKEVTYCSVHEYQPNNDEKDNGQSKSFSLHETYAYFKNSDFFHNKQKKSKTNSHGAYSFLNGKFSPVVDDHMLRNLLLSLPFVSSISTKCVPHPDCSPKAQQQLQVSPELQKLASELFSFKQRSSEQQSSVVQLKGGRTISSNTTQPLVNSYEDLTVIYYVENVFVWSGAGTDLTLTAANWVGGGQIDYIQIVVPDGSTRPSAIILVRETFPGTDSASFLFRLQHAENGYTFRVGFTKLVFDPSVVLKTPGGNRKGVDIYSLVNTTTTDGVLVLRNTETLADDLLSTMNISTIITSASLTPPDRLSANFRLSNLVITASWQQPYALKNIFYSLETSKVVQILDGTLPTVPPTSSDPKARRDFLYSYSSTEFVLFDTTQLSRVAVTPTDWSLTNYQTKWNVTLPSSLYGVKRVAPLPSDERQKLTALNGASIPAGQTEIESIIMFGTYKPALPSDTPNFQCNWQLYNRDFSNVFFLIGSVVFGPANSSVPSSPSIYSIVPLGNCFTFPMSDGDMIANFTSDLFYNTGYRILSQNYLSYQIKVPLSAFNTKANVSFALESLPPVSNPSAYAPTPAPPPVTLPPTVVPPTVVYTFTPQPKNGDVSLSSHLMMTILCFSLLLSFLLN